MVPKEMIQCSTNLLIGDGATKSLTVGLCGRHIAQFRTKLRIPAASCDQMSLLPYDVYFLYRRILMDGEPVPIDCNPLVYPLVMDVSLLMPIRPPGRE